MNKNNHKRLIEMMERVNPDYKPSDPTEKEIIDDILSLDEGVSNIFSKMKEYARKGLLTATIILSVASAVAAGNIGDGVNSNDVIEKGIEMVDDTHEKRVYAFFVGIADQYLKRAAVDAENQTDALKDIINYYALLWDGANPEQLTGKAKIINKSIIKNAKKFGPEKLDYYTNLGLDRLKSSKK